MSVWTHLKLLNLGIGVSEPEKEQRAKGNQRAVNKEICSKQMGGDYYFYYPNSIFITVLFTWKIFDAIKCTQYWTELYKLTGPL